MEKEQIISVIPLPNEETLNSLTEYNIFLKSLFIKQLKSITSVGGYTSLVSCNSLDRIDISDEICQLINAIIIKIPCFSIYSGIIMSSILTKLWTEPLCEYGKASVVNALLEFQILLESSLENMKVEDTIDIDFLQRLITPVLLEELTLCLEKPFLQKVSLQIVKAVLSMTDTEKELKLGRITVHVEQGHDECFITNGVLCEIDDSNAKLVKSDFTNPLDTRHNIILFAENLDFNSTPDAFVGKMVENNIKIVACQKKVSDTLKLYLRRRRILLIERMGEEIARSLELLTGGTLIRDLMKIGSDDIATFIGEFSNVRQFDNSSKNRIFIENKENRITFIYAKCRCFSDINILRTVINKCIRLIWSTLSSPFFLPGPVYFETTLSSILKLKSINNFMLEQITKAFENVLKEISSLYEGSTGGNLEFPKHNYFLLRNAFVHICEGIISILSIAHIIKKN